LKKEFNASLKDQRKGEDDNVLPFEQPTLATAPSPPGGDWLRTLPHETRFIARPRNYKGPWLNAYGVAGIIPAAVCLAIFQDGNMTLQWVDSKNFSQQNEFVSILPEMKEAEQPPEEEP
jgi:hypothetical protein